MNPLSVLKHPSAFLPLVMSVGALATVLVFLTLNGPAPQADEGSAAHIWQLLIGAQVPIIVFFAFKWVPRSPRQAVTILALQCAAALVAMVPVLLLHW
jgi:peptidoglycan/LPS O-acetylase OafA/YrhL